MQGPLSLAGRVLLCVIFALSAVTNKIPNFQTVAGGMERAGVPMPSIALAGAIVFLIVGSILVVVGYKARFGAALLAIFLVLASVFFHPFWKDPAHIIDFLKNMSILGAMLFIMANGPGAMSYEKKG